ncbi:hypothetical protein CU097_010151 [Rhizopus azygosporus]|uniref:Dynactin subunit 4 n=1 Tax=Rhizopus azygosporus TaxID=86630 RepID=A0A367JY68_RHIAZ|nr:hypothetical protein CU097_010151 [Rhizopus azygosporus]
MIPFVDYYCSCSTKDNLEGNSDESTESVTGLHLLSKKAKNYLYPLSRLYFCEDCHQIRCPSCVQDEIVSYYCPNCLFEVPTASVKSEKNRCARNCFQCPICQNTLSVVASQEPNQTSTTVTAPAGPYFLACNVCRWTSQEISMTFEKPTSLALQLQKNEEALPDTKEFDQLKEHFEKHLRVNSVPSLPTTFLSFTSSSAFSKYMGTDSSGSGGKIDDINGYEPSVQIPDDDLKLLDSMITLRNIDKVSTLTQRSTQLHDQPHELGKIHPQRIHLAIKRSKRCRTCRHILIKPEQKAQATRFKIKLVAMNYIPNITLIPKKNWPLQVNVPTQILLKFTNPLYEEMHITLATPLLKENANGRVTILCPHFTVGAYNETIEYDDEMYPRRNNNHLSLPLLVTYNYKSDEDRMDVSSGDIDADDIMDDTDDNSSLGKKSNIRLEDDKIKSYSFWCLIGLGSTD